MKLLSINVSQAREVEYNGKLIKTGIFKKPVSGSIMITAHHIVGDEQVDLVNHGGEHKAVYAFSAEHYDYWQQQLGMELHFGQFGENLTISNLDERTLCIGDQIQIGDVVLEVTQPRVPCFKLGIALALKTMPKLFIEHGYTGIYFRIIKSGTIIAGDSVTVIYKHPDKLSVHTLFNAYFDKRFNHAHDVMQLASNNHALSNEWMEKVTQRLNST